jgi:hypothetical protein
MLMEYRLDPLKALSPILVTVVARHTLDRLWLSGIDRRKSIIQTY